MAEEILRLRNEAFKKALKCLHKSYKTMKEIEEIKDFPKILSEGNAINKDLIKADENLEKENKRLKKKIQQLEEETTNLKEEKYSMLVELKCKHKEIKHLKKQNKRRETAMRPMQEIQLASERSRSQLQNELFHRHRLEPYIAVAQDLSLEESGRLVTVPNTIFDVPFENGLFIRQEYLDVSHIIAKKLASDQSIRRVLVLGSPGIGKSVFGVLLFLLAIKEKKDVAYRQANETSPYYFTWTGSNYEISDSPYFDKLYEAYFDGDEKGGALRLTSFSRVFLFPSLGHGNYNEFVKERCMQVYMNPWSKQECERFAEVIAVHDNDEWLRKYNLVGGKPRFLFSTIQFEDLVTRVKNDIPLTVVDLKRQVILFDRGTFHDKMRHILFSIHRNDARPNLFYLTYSSYIVEVIIQASFHIESANEVCSLLQNPASFLQTWRGKEKERFLLEDLETAILSIRSIEEPDVGHIQQLGPFHANTRVIEAVSEIKNELSFHIPLSKDFPAIDGVFVIPSDRLVIYVQATVSTGHPINYSQMKNIYEYLSQQNEFHGYRHILLFLVSDDIFDIFCAVPYKKTDGFGIKVKQYVGRLLEVTHKNNEDKILTVRKKRTHMSGRKSDCKKKK